MNLPGQAGTLHEPNSTIVTYIRRSYRHMRKKRQNEERWTHEAVEQSDETPTIGRDADQKKWQGMLTTSN